ncbi:MAG: hypothetical protein HY712_00905 [candidate division NC10 bacterium]|nr:hypothetical protein [candidate division NC10 bacterium]
MRLFGRVAIMRYLGYSGTCHHTWASIRQRFSGAIYRDVDNGRVWAEGEHLDALRSAGDPAAALRRLQRQVERFETRRS